MSRFLRVVLVTFLLGSVLTVQAPPAKADFEGLVPVLIGMGAGGVLNITSIVANSVYLGEKKHLSTSWQALGYTVGGITTGFGLFFVIGGGIGDPLFLSVLVLGATTLTTRVLAGTRNKPKDKPSVAFSPILLRDVEGGLTPGVGLSLMSF